MMENVECGHFKKRRTWAAMLAVLLSACASPPVESSVPSEPVSQASITPGVNAAEIRAELSAKEVPDGAALWVSIQLPPARAKSSVIGHFDGIELPFFPDAKRCDSCVSSVLGIPHGHKLGQAEIFIEVEGEAKPLRIPVEVIDGQYASERLKVNPKHVNPPAKYLARIQRDSHAVGQAYARMTHEKMWEGAFVLPIQSAITSPYGTKRMYNGELRNYHGGLDLKAAVGTRVHAAAGGIVAMSQDLFYTGNTVIIDHGYGVFTVYAHLSRVKVKLGQRLTQGDLIGLSGKTGRVTGPHLHWQTVIHHVKVNPAAALRVMR